jgi:hypothetical protein
VVCAGGFGRPGRSGLPGLQAEQRGRADRDRAKRRRGRTRTQGPPRGWQLGWQHRARERCYHPERRGPIVCGQERLLLWMKYVCTIIAHIPGEAIWIERVAGANEVLVTLYRTRGQKSRSAGAKKTLQRARRRKKGKEKLICAQGRGEIGKDADSGVTH